MGMGASVDVGVAVVVTVGVDVGGSGSMVEVGVGVRVGDLVAVETDVGAFVGVKVGDSTIAMAFCTREKAAIDNAKTTIEANSITNPIILLALIISIPCLPHLS